MKWPKLISGTLIRRYKRFLFDVRLKNNHTITAHSPNTGSMLGCCAPGSRVFLSKHNNPKRNFKFTVEMIETDTTLVGINTLLPNRLIRKVITSGEIKVLSGYSHIRPEVPYGENSRIDLLLENGKKRCFVEIKNCTLVEDQVAYFPDAVSRRGLKHLLELQRQVKAGHRCVMFYLIQRTDAKSFKPADHIDPDYGRGLRSAVSGGVEIMVYDVKLDLEKIELNKPVPYVL
jgi:sugar fermentation stimulation protein A